MRTGNKINGKRIILLLSLLLIVVGLVQGKVGAFFVVKGNSMYPTFNSDDVVLTGPVHARPHRGDVVILTDNRGDQVIKRVLGLPGETVVIYRGFLYIGQRRLYEPYLARKTYTFNSDPQNERAVVWHLKAGQFFVLGDNRLESCDSRQFGPVEQPQIRGIVNLPENSARPEFCNIIYSEKGKVSSHPSRSSAAPEQSRSHLPIANAKS